MTNATTTTPTRASSCQPYCRIHDDELGACLAADIRLDFDKPTPGDSCHHAAIALTSTNDGTHSIGLSLNWEQYTELHPDRAAAIAYGILAQLATANGQHTIAAFRRAQAQARSIGGAQ